MMLRVSLVLLAGALGLGAAEARMITVKNNCAFTVWPAVYTDPNVGSVPTTPTGWSAASGTSTSITVPDNWTAGRIWARQSCTFSSSGSGTCVTGNCPAGLVCANGLPSGPVTLAEFTLSSAGQDYVDVSLVEGFNLPVKITDTNNCVSASCPKDLNTICPSKLRGPTNSTGSVIGCNSDCAVDTNPSNSGACCTGTHGTPSTCPPSGVPDYAFFKGNCPNSYVFAYDEGSTALWVCPSSPAPQYTVTFCP